MIRVLLAIVLVLLQAALAPATGAPSPPVFGCAVQHLALSACLPQEVAPPGGDGTPSLSAACCEAFLTVLDGDARCLCPLIRESNGVGFPLNSSALVSHFSSCDGLDADASEAVLEESCSGHTEAALGDVGDSSPDDPTRRRPRPRPPRPSPRSPPPAPPTPELPPPTPDVPDVPLPPLPCTCSAGAPQHGGKIQLSATAVILVLIRALAWS